MMTEYRGEYGKRWDRRLPRDSIKRYVYRQHVGTPFEEIETTISKACVKNAIPERMRPKCVEYARCVYDENRDLYRRVMSGRL